MREHQIVTDSGGQAVTFVPVEQDKEDYHSVPSACSSVELTRIGVFGNGYDEGFYRKDDNFTDDWYNMYWTAK